MHQLLSFAPVLGCGAMMAVCMGLMGRGRSKPAGAEADTVDRAQIDALREEIAELRAERDRG